MKWHLNWFLVMDNFHIQSALILLFFAMSMTACQTTESTPNPPTEVAIVRQIATVGPTATPDPAMQSLQPSPTPTITAIPSPTAYVGEFLGEVAPQDDILSQPRTNNDGGVQPVVQLVDLQCEIPPDAIFGTGWQGESRAVNGLGCPIQASFGFPGQVQVFEDGIMYLRPEIDQVWGVAPGGLTIIGEHWSVSELPLVSPVGLQAPDGFFVPDGAIGAVWASVPELREALGFATTQVSDVGINIQRFEGGTLLADIDGGQVFALLVNGVAFGPY